MLRASMAFPGCQQEPAKPTHRRDFLFRAAGERNMFRNRRQHAVASFQMQQVSGYTETDAKQIDAPG